MGVAKCFKDVVAWQKAYILVKDVYIITRNFPRSEEFGLSSQIRRASVSVASNIVEGFSRKGLKESLSFYNIANASLEEVKFQLMLSYDFKYISEIDFNTTYSKAEETSRVLRGWIQGHHKNNY